VPPPSTTFRTAIRSFALVALLVGPAGCRDAATAFGPSPDHARANADALFFALSTRFGPSEAAPGYEETRARFSRSALVPSRLFNDRTVWTDSAEDVRRLGFTGYVGETSYHLGIRDTVPPRRLGDYRRSTRLRSLGQGQYEWTIRDELAVGSASPGDLGAALAAMLAVAERSDSSAIRAAYHTDLPRTTATLGRLFTMDSITAAPTRGGGTLLSIRATIHNRRIADEFPSLSRYLERYVGPLRFSLEVRDPSGVRWWTARLERNRVAIDLRVSGGRLVPLEGRPRRMPDRLTVHVDGSTRIRIFNVGISDLVGDVVLTRSPNDVAFTARFRREPDWHLPLLVERLIRSPLRRPFEGNGSSMTLSARNPRGVALLVRGYQITVQESAILRWFGGLGSTAIGDFRGDTEEEYDRFNGRFLEALRLDALDLIP
jgi:hypothetical protein